MHRAALPDRIRVAELDEAINLLTGLVGTKDAARGAALLDSVCASGNAKACRLTWLTQNPREYKPAPPPLRDPVRRRGALWRNECFPPRPGRVATRVVIDNTGRVFGVRVVDDGGLRFAFAECKDVGGVTP